MIKTPVSLVLFDGVCSLCNASVDFLVRADRKKKLRYASLQSEAGQAVLKSMGKSTVSYDSFVLYTGSRVLERSTAALTVCRILGGWFYLCTPFFLVPEILRNLVYDYVATHRYQWFGKKESCRIPMPEERHLFIESEAELKALFSNEQSPV